MSYRLLDAGFSVRSVTGAAVSGAKLKFFESGTTTPKSVYSDPSLGTSLGSEVTCNDEGFPASGGAKVNLFGEGDFKLEVTDAAGVVLPNYGADPLERDGVTLGDLASIDSLTALAKDSLVDGDVYIVTGIRGGTFRWDANSTEATNSGTVFAADEGGTGRWGREFDGSTYVAEWFGDMTVDAGAVINTAQAAMVNGDTLLITSSGQIPLLTTIAWSKSGCIIRGQNSWVELEKRGDIHGMEVTGIFNQFFDFSLYCDGTDTDKDGIRINGPGGRNAFTRVLVNNHSAAGFRWMDGNYLEMNFCRATNSNDGFIGTTDTLDNNAGIFNFLLCDGNTRYGFYLEGDAGNPGSGSESSQHYGFVACSFNGVRNHQIETNRSHLTLYAEGSPEPESILGPNTQGNRIVMVAGDCQDQGRNSIDQVGDTIQSKPLRFWTVNTDGWDYQVADLTTDSSWQTLNLVTDISVLPKNTRMVRFRIAYNSANASASFQYQQAGAARNISTPGVRTVVSGANHEEIIEVPVNADGEMEYNASDVTWNSLNLKAIGYWTH